MSNRYAIIQLGRLGDILNILPLAAWLNSQGKRATIFVHRDFQGVSESVSYADFHVCDCADYRMSQRAFGQAVEMGFFEIYRTQLVDGKNVNVSHAPSFCETAYTQVLLGREWRSGLFDKIIIDRRYPEDEAIWKDLFNPDHYTLPLVLVNPAAVSNPVPHGLMPSIIEALSPIVRLVDLSKIRAKRFTDLLGLYDRAKCLVTVDTATLHLAGAHSIPYVALLADKPTPWFGSYCRGNVIHKARYGDAVTDPDFVNKIVRAVESAIEK